jgi:hypothetical protein
MVGFNTSATLGILSTLSNSWLSVDITGLTGEKPLLFRRQRSVSIMHELGEKFS